MDAELKKKWVDALRSGKYKQGRNVLRQGYGDNTLYCCLGVLLDVRGAGWRPDRSVPFPDAATVGQEQATSVRHRDLAVLPLGLRKTLTVLNDVEQYNFQQIADWIELNVPTEGSNNV